MEPTRKQFDILSDVYENGSVEKLDKDKDIEQYWTLVHGGYLHNLVSVGVMWDWKFVLTDKGKQYIAPDECENNNSTVAGQSSPQA